MRIFAIILGIFAATHLSARQADTIFAFWESGEFKKTRMSVVGETAGIEKSSVFESSQDYDLNVDTRPDMVTVKVTNPDGLRVGQILYLVETDFDYKGNNQGTIVGQFIVKSIFNTAFFGLNLRGEGYFRLIEDRIMTVVRPLESSKIQEAYLIKKEGDLYRNKGETDKAIQSYKKAVSFDPDSPDNHYALARLHIEDIGEGYISAGFELEQTWKNRDKFSDSYEKLSFYEDYMKYQIYRYLLEGNYSKTALLSKSLAAGKESKMLVKNHFGILLYTAETDLLLSRTYKTDTAGERTAKEDLLNDAALNLEQAEKINKGDYHLYNLAVRVYHDLLNAQSSPTNERSAEFVSKIKHAGKMYIKFKPNSRNIDDETRAILMKTGVIN